MAETKKYTIGKGRISFKPDVNGVEGKSYLKLGNAPAITLTLTTEKLEHFSSEAGLQVKDASIITKTTLMSGFTLDEPSIDNLKMFMMSKNKYEYTQTAQAVLTAIAGEGAAAGTLNIGSLGSYTPLYHSTNGTAVAGAPVANAANDGTTGLSLGSSTAPAATVTTVYEIRLSTEGTPDQVVWRANGGAWQTPVALVETAGGVQLGTTGVYVTALNDDAGTAGDMWTITVSIPNLADTRVFNITTGTGTFELKDPTDTITYVEGTEGNYQVDRKAGILYINKDQTGADVVNAIVPGDGFRVKAKWDANTTAAHVEAFTLTSLRGHLMFIGDPPTGEATDVQGYVSLTPTGDLALIGTDWSQMQFEAEFLAHPRYQDSEDLQGLARMTYRQTIA